MKSAHLLESGRHAAIAVALAHALFATSAAAAEHVTLNFRTENPARSERQIYVKRYLPPEVQTNDVVSLDGLEMTYDVRSGLYYVHAETTVGPGEAVDHKVVLKDIWVLSEEFLTDFEAQADSLSRLMAKDGKAVTLGEEINRGLATIREIQMANTVDKVGSEKHIDAYDENTIRLQSVQRTMARIEIMAIRAGHDPTRVYGLVRTSRNARDPIVPTNGMGTVIFRLSVANPSSTPIQIPVKADLPREVGVNDVLDAGELSAHADLRRGICYVYKDQVNIPPGGMVEFSIALRDRWNVNSGRIAGLHDRASQALKNIEEGEARDAAAQTLSDILAELEAIAAATGPRNFGQDYIAFYRGQTEQLNFLEDALNQITSLPPPEGTAFDATWTAVWSVLGFVALVAIVVIGWSAVNDNRKTRKKE
jgi:hypothetical protein